MRVFRRYLLIQIPGWILVAIILTGLHLWVGLPVWAALGLYVIYVGKDFVLYPFLQRAYETDAPTGAELLTGETGIAAENLDPAGYVRIRGELWRAEAAPGVGSIPEGSRVRVESTRGLTLIVTPDSGP